MSDTCKDSEEAVLPKRPEAWQAAACDSLITGLKRTQSVGSIEASIEMNVLIMHAISELSMQLTKY